MKAWLLPAAVAALHAQVWAPPLGLDVYMPVPEANPLTAAKIELGRQLFFDKGLSRDGTLACASCHDPARAFSDGRPVSTGIGGAQGTRNAPAIINRGYGRSFFWDGRAQTLEQQALEPILNPRELGLTEQELEQRTGRKVAEVTAALASYVRSIRSGDSRYDRFTEGQTNALSDLQKSGLEIFRGKGHCVTCHVGPNFTDEQYHNTGIAWRAESFADEGRFAVTHDSRERGAFKTPTLRDVARTGPYMHDGSLATLDEVIDFYSEGGRANPYLDPQIRPRHFTAGEKRALAAFLKALSGEAVPAHQGDWGILDGARRDTMWRVPRTVTWLLFASVLGLPAAWAQKTRMVDDAALKDAGKTGNDWISYNVNWSEQRYSPLTQINDGNVKRLGLAWYTDLPAATGRAQNHQEATPLVVNGVLYSITPWSVVYAVDARTGKEVWHSDPDVNQKVWQSRICCGVVNRGIALYKGKIIAPVIDGRLRALDGQTGKLVWEARVSPETMPYTITMAPRVIKGGKVIIGISGGEYAVRGFFAAYDAETGKLAWRFYTVPGDPSKPFEQPELAAAAKTWSGEWWKTGGGASVWNGMAYDADADIVYVGTGQPGPWTDVSRGAGDNLFANCILAVRGATGKLVWYYQEVPGDNWDYDSIADLMLADLTIHGKRRHVIMHAPKDGFFYVLDRRTGELISADPWVTVTWAKGIDLKTGRPIVNPGANYGTNAVSVMPGPGGGHVWPPWSFDPATGLVYIPSTIGGSYTYAADPKYVPAPTDIGPEGHARFNMGTTFNRGRRAGTAGTTGDSETHPGATPTAEGEAPPAALPAIGPKGKGNILVAWDPVERKERWRGLSAGFSQGGTLATGGNLVFSSVHDRLLAYRADTGEQVLDLQTGLSQMGPPMTFQIDGEQYIAVAGGPPGLGDNPFETPSDGAAPTQPSRLLAFRLDGNAKLPPAPQKPPSEAGANPAP